MNDPVPNSCPFFHLHKVTIDYLEHKMEELRKKQAILLSHELQPHETSAKPCRESFSWSHPKSHSKPITIFCQFVGWLKMNILMNNLHENIPILSIPRNE